MWSPEKNFQHPEALAALERVLAVQPNFERALNRVSAICWHIERMEEARIAHGLARRSNPKTKTQNLGFIDLFSGDFAGAEQGAKVWLAEAPGNLYYRAFAVCCALLAGDLELAGERLAGTAEELLNDPYFAGVQGLFHARRRETGRALECVRKALDSPHSLGHIQHAYHQIASVYAVLGDSERVMAWLERTVDTGFPCWSFFRIDPHFEILRELPAFQTLISGLERKYTALKILLP